MKLMAAGREEIGKEKSVRIDYFEIVNAETLNAMVNVERGALAAVAAFVGMTRLIDNVLLGE